MAEETLENSETESNLPRKFLGIELTLKPSKGKKAAKPVIQVGPTPIADFLPSRVREGKSAKYVRSRLFAASVSTVAISFLAYLASIAVALSGNIILENAELRLASVKAEQAKYSPVRDLENEIRFQEASRVVATGTQVDTSQLIRALTQQLPNGASYTSIQITQFEPSDLETSGLTKEFSVKASISMELKDYPSLQLYLNRLPSLNAFYDARLVSVSTTDVGIAVSLVLYMNTDLYSRLYLEPMVLGDPVPISILDTKPRIEQVTTGPEDETQVSPTPAPTPKPSATPTSVPTPSPTEDVTG